ncbi:MAG: redoxin domain-containing protein [Alphaproteobacteria bacterium]|nr:redoxin domain-containing protein [Alphaproteobacteria bacterium]
MKKVWMSGAAVAVVAAVAGVASVRAAPNVQTSASVPERVGDFQLTDTTRLGHRLSYFKYAPAIVLMSQTNGSRMSRTAAGELAKLQAAYKDKGVLFYMINSNLSDTRDQAAAEAAANKFAVPLLMDDLQLVGEQLNVQREGEVYVIDPKAGFRVAYHGPLDDRFTSANPVAANAPRNAYAASAIDSVLAGRPVATPRIDVKVGKTISFPERAKSTEFAKISYTETVAPILQQKCVTCHQKGGIAPFAMNSYEVVKGFAPMMLETVMAKRMPPWFADPHVGKFSNDTALTPDQSRTLVHWLEAGAPRGEGEDILKTEAGEAPEWPTALGKPDVVVQLPAFDVPATGVIEYQSVMIDNPFKGDAWLRAVAFQPGARPVLHHITSSYSPDRSAPSSGIPGSSVGSFVPGAGIQTYNEGTGAPVPAGGKLRYSMHYTTTGRAMSDSTRIGYYLLKKPPEIIRRAAVISDPSMLIPAGEARHKEVAYIEFPADAVLYSVHPHAHYRGFSVELKEKTPDGKETPLLSVPQYDFNWQLDYDLAEPLNIKAGTKLIVTWIYDNSAHNPSNPDPRKDIAWGEQTWEEMMYFRVNYRWSDETSSHIRNDLQAKLMDSRTIGSLDDNADGKVQINELTGTMVSLRSRFADLDLNKDGGLDKDELAVGHITGATARRLRDTDNDL